MLTGKWLYIIGEVSSTYPREYLLTALLEITIISIVIIDNFCFTPSQLLLLLLILYLFFTSNQRRIISSFFVCLFTAEKYS